MGSEMGIATEFRGNIFSESRRQISLAKKEINKKLSFDLLVKLLKRYRDCFKRYVAREVGDEIHHPSFPDVFYYCLYHIGRIGEHEWFFEDEEGTVMMYRAKSLRPIPRVEVLGCEVSRIEIEAIVNYLDKVKLVRGANRTVVVPKGFYVFEFKALDRSNQPRIITTTPFEAKNLDKAIKIFRQCPWYYYRDCAYFSNFRVCTTKGWTNLKHTLLNEYANPWVGRLDNYVITVE